MGSLGKAEWVYYQRSQSISLYSLCILLPDTWIKYSALVSADQAMFTYVFAFFFVFDFIGRQYGYIIIIILHTQIWICNPRSYSMETYMCRPTVCYGACDSQD